METGSAGMRNSEMSALAQAAAEKNIQATVKKRLNTAVNQGREIEYRQSSVKNEIAQKWGKEKGLQSAVSEILETFGTDKVMRKAEGINLIESSGNQVLKRGILNNIKLGQDTGKRKLQGSALVSNNDILSAWNTGYSDEKREIVMDYSKSASEKQTDRVKPGIGMIDFSA